MRRWTVLLPLAIAACATTGPGGGGNVVIETAAGGQAVAGAACTVTTNSGAWKVLTPASLNLGTPSGDLRVVCDKNGYRTSEVVYRPSTPFGSSVGVGVGGGSGNVGVGVGLSMPVLLGRGGYPSRITVNLNPL